MDDLIQRLRAEPTASQFMRIGDLVESLVAERKEAADRIAALEAEREQQEPVAYVTDEPSPNPEPIAWLAGKRAGMKLYAEPPVPHVEQEPVAWVLFDDIFIAPKDMQDDPPNLEYMKPLYAHPLALREPTEDECRRIANEFLILGGPDELAGRVMFNAVREVMTK